MTWSLFDSPTREERLGPGTVLLGGFALGEVERVLAGLEEIVARAPFRHMVTPGGFRMSVAMTNCGALGWLTDRRGYRYDTLDPVTGRPWPPLPEAFRQLAEAAAVRAGFPGFVPDACLINRYEPGAKMSLHQDRNERDFTQPIVSVSLGLPAVFLLGGAARAERPSRIPLTHGDVLVWGGQDRLRFHGILPLKAGRHALLGRTRVNLTLRRAGD
jgi:alkylated DNA repair protein (DNA oxidative demethylase)